MPRRYIVRTMCAISSIIVPISISAGPAAASKTVGNRTSLAERPYPALDGSGRMIVSRSSQIQFRRANGMRADRDFVAAVAAEPNAAANEYGLPLTAGELADLRHRRDVQMAANPLLRGLSRNQRRDLASAYFDQLHGGRLTLKFVRNAVTYRSAIKGRFSYPDDLLVTTGRYRMSYLNGVVARISALQAVDPSLAIVDTYRDDFNNRVVVDVRRQALRATARRLAQVAGTGAFLTVRPTDARARTTVETGAYTAPPTMGGQGIVRAEDSTHVIICTSGFTADVPSGAHFLLTAGHCAHSGDNSQFPWFVGDEFDPNSILFEEGPITNFNFDSGHEDDAAIIPLPANAGPVGEVVNGFTPPLAVIGEGTELDADDMPGAQSVLTGQIDNGSGPMGGTFSSNVISNNFTATYPAEHGFPSVTLTHARTAGEFIVPGFSGGPVWAPRPSRPTSTPGVEQFTGIAQGITSGVVTESDGTELFMIYTHIREATRNLSVDIATS